MIRNGVVITTPHYQNIAGPRSQIDQTLKNAWDGFDAKEAIRSKLKTPTQVLNDAQLHGLGVIEGVGVELVLTFGTGLGYALRLAKRIQIKLPENIKIEKNAAALIGAAKLKNPSSFT